MCVHSHGFEKHQREQKSRSAAEASTCSKYVALSFGVRAPGREGWIFWAEGQREGVMTLRRCLSVHYRESEEAGVAELEVRVAGGEGEEGGGPSRLKLLAIIRFLAFCLKVRKPFQGFC